MSTIQARRLASFAALVVLLLPGAIAAAAEAPSTEPSAQDVMIDVSTRLFAALDSNRAAIRRNAEAVYPLVDQTVFPHFDVDYATQLVLAQHWREATPEQRQRFVAAFYHALLRTYGSALADATADRLKVLPFRGDAGAPQASVRTQVTWIASCAGTRTLPPRWPHFFAEESWSSKWTQAAPPSIIAFISS